MTIVCGQCDEATLIELALRATYKVDVNNRNLMHFLGRLKDICYRNGDGSLSYTTYKVLKYIEAECIIRSMCYNDNRQRSFNCYKDNSNCYF